MSTSVIIALAASLAGILGAVAFALVKQRHKKAIVMSPALATVTFVESSAVLVNPERGFYVGLDLVGGANSPAGVRAKGYTLALAMVRLDAYRAKLLDGAILGLLEAGFVRVRAAGIKVVLRFAYNAGMAPDAPLNTILDHIVQLAPVLRKNADVIAVLQAGFIGAWGEWHSSTNGLDTPVARRAILGALLAAFPGFVQVRRPDFKSEYSGPERERIGHHDDAFLGSASDQGTYTPDIAEDKAVVAADVLVPVGGETDNPNPPRSDCPAALAELAANHWSFLNHEYHPGVLAGWKTQGCYDEIERRLGYRLVLEEAVYTADPIVDGTFELVVNVRNLGFAAPFNKRPVFVVLTTGILRVVRPVDVDVRLWAPGKTVTVSARVTLDRLADAGVYTVSLWLPDAAEDLRRDPRYAIQLANEGTWDAKTGENVLVRKLRVA